MKDERKPIFVLFDQWVDDYNEYTKLLREWEWQKSYPLVYVESADLIKFDGQKVRVPKPLRTTETFPFLLDVAAVKVFEKSVWAGREGTTAKYYLDDEEEDVWFATPFPQVCAKLKELGLIR